MQMDVIEGFRLSPQQRHLWSLQQAGDEWQYRAQCAILIEGSLDLRVLKAILRDISDRYEILRTGFRCSPGTNLPLQAVNEQSAPWIEEYNLRTCDGSRQDAEVETGSVMAGKPAEFTGAVRPLNPEVNASSSGGRIAKVGSARTS